MRFHCSRCGKDFTTLSQSKEKRVAFSNLILEGMTCPNCGATNYTKNLKPLKKTRGRWQPKRRSADTDEITQPVTLSEICQRRLMVGFGDRISTEVVCDGCPSSFNCLTGNIDDGQVNAITEKEFKYKAVNETAKIVAEAQVMVARRKDEEETRKADKIKRFFTYNGFSCEESGGFARIKYRGTIWKLDKEDVKAIIDNTWSTIKSAIIRRTFVNRDIDPKLAVELLHTR